MVRLKLKNLLECEHAPKNSQKSEKLNDSKLWKRKKNNDGGENAKVNFMKKINSLEIIVYLNSCGESDLSIWISSKMNEWCRITDAKPRDENCSFKYFGAKLPFVHLASLRSASLAKFKSATFSFKFLTFFCQKK